MKKHDVMTSMVTRGIKSLYIISLMSAIAVCSVMSSCGGNTRQSVSDTAAIGDTVTVNTEDSEEPLILSSDGIGPVSCPMQIAELQSFMEGVYDEVMVEEGSDSDIYRFIYNGQERFRGYNFGEDSLQMLCASDESVKVDTGDGFLSIGSPFGEVLKLDGVEAEFESLDGIGIWGWKWRGLYFLPSQRILPETLAAKLYNGDEAPQSSDFSDDVVIEYIGTGLPF